MESVVKLIKRNMLMRKRMEKKLIPMSNTEKVPFHKVKVRASNMNLVQRIVNLIPQKSEKCNIFIKKSKF